MSELKKTVSRVFTSDELEAKGIPAAAQSYCVKEGVLLAISEPLKGWVEMPTTEDKGWSEVAWSLIADEDRLACWSILGHILQTEGLR